MGVEHEFGQVSRVPEEVASGNVFQRGQGRSTHAAHRGTFASLNHSSEENEEDHEEEMAKCLSDVNKYDDLETNAENGGEERPLHQEDVDMREAGNQDMYERDDEINKDDDMKDLYMAKKKSVGWLEREPFPKSGEEEEAEQEEQAQDTESVATGGEEEEEQTKGGEEDEEDEEGQGEEEEEGQMDVGDDLRQRLSDMDVDAPVVQEVRRDLRPRIPKAKASMRSLGTASSHRPKKTIRPPQDALARTNDNTVRPPSASIRWQTPFLTNEDTKGWNTEEPITLDLSQQASKVQAVTEWTLFDAKGIAHKRRPRVHVSDKFIVRCKFTELA